MVAIIENKWFELTGHNVCEVREETTADMQIPSM